MPKPWWTTNAPYITYGTTNSTSTTTGTALPDKPPFEIKLNEQF